MLVKSPLSLSPGFLDAFGYAYSRRFVALYWEPCGDEACYSDGVSSTCGCCDNFMYLNLVRQPELRLCLYANGFNLGSSDEPATAWLLADRLTGILYVGPKNEVHAILLEQRILDENKTNEP